MAKHKMLDPSASRMLTQSMANCNELLYGPKCEREESAALTKAALVAIRKLANEAGKAGKATAVGQWKLDYDAMVKSSKTYAEFLNKFAVLTENLKAIPTQDLSPLCLIEASHQALSATYEDGSREFRLEALFDAGIASGALAMLENPGELETRFKKRQAERAADARHKDDRADRAHVAKWLSENRSKYRTDDERADAIVTAREVSAQRSTVRRYITEWNRAQREAKKSENA